MKNKPKGFTLIELLVVIAIIGILSTIVMAFLGSAKNQGSDGAIKKMIYSMKEQAELYYIGTGNQSYGPGNNDAQNKGLCFPAGGAPGGWMASPTIFNAQTKDSLRNLALGVVNLGSTLTCIASSTPEGPSSVTWAVSGSLKSGGYYCVDSTGNVKTTATSLNTNLTASGLCI